MTSNQQPIQPSLTRHDVITTSTIFDFNPVLLFWTISGGLSVVVAYSSGTPANEPAARFNIVMILDL